MSVCVKARTSAHVDDNVSPSRSKDPVGKWLDVGRGDRVQSSVSAVAGADNVFTGQSDWRHVDTCGVRMCAWAIQYNTHTHTDGTDGPWRASEIQCMCVPSFVDVWVCRLYQRVYMLHQSYCFATSFRIDIRSKAMAFSELLARNCLIGNLVNCKSYARDWIDSVSSRWRRRGGRRWNWLKLRNKSTIKFIQPRISVKLKSLPWHEPFWVDIFKQ